MRKVYKTPEIRTEIIEVGVFGDYSTDDQSDNFYGYFNPFFGLCCAG